LSQDGNRIVAVEDTEEFKEWDEASKQAALRLLMLDHLKETGYPENSALYRHAKRELEKAEAHLAEIQSKW
jgi:hypothetical protein